MLRKILPLILMLQMFLFTNAEQVFKQKDDAFVKDNSGATLINIRTTHLFSGIVRQDHFKLSLEGRSIINGLIIFQISDYGNKMIYKDSFPATDLLWNYDEAPITLRQKERIILKRIKQFLSDSCFFHPAITIANPFDSDNIDKKIWQDIKSDKDAIGFVYSHGYEGTYGIAFSKKRKKVVIYYYSD